MKHQQELPQYIQDKITFSPEPGCWAWRGRIEKVGYGRVKYCGRPRSTHKLIYELLVGPVPDGLQLDHLCRNRNCCNPQHLEPVTARENTIRGVGPSAINYKKTHCSQGHSLEGENLVVKTKKSGTPERVCRICRNETARRGRRNFSPEQIFRVKEREKLRVRDWKAERVRRTPEQIERAKAYERSRPPRKKSQPPI